VTFYGFSLGFIRFLALWLQVGVGNLVYVLGQLQYQKLGSAGADYWIVGVAVTGGTMLTVIFIILVVYKRKSTRAERQFKRLQLQLDSLESNIRNECKQGQYRNSETETEQLDDDSVRTNVQGCSGAQASSLPKYALKLLFCLLGTLFKKPKAPSFQIGPE